jgi:hypothetical protein
MIDLIQPKYHEECLLTVVREESIALSGKLAGGPHSKIDMDSLEYKQLILYHQQTLVNTTFRALSS